MGILKEFGLHHGIIAFVVSYFLGLPGAAFMIGGYIMKEGSENMRRHNSEKLYSGYQRPGTVEWPDLIAPIILSSIALWLR